MKQPSEPTISEDQIVSMNGQVTLPHLHAQTFMGEERVALRYRLDFHPSFLHQGTFAVDAFTNGAWNTVWEIPGSTLGKVPTAAEPGHLEAYQAIVQDLAAMARKVLSPS